MVDVDTFLTTLYVIVDDFCTLSLPVETHPGPHAALTRSEVVTLAIFGQWQGCGSERGFYRYAHHHQELRSRSDPLQGWQCELSALEVEAPLELPPGALLVETFAFHHEIRHQA